MFSNWVVLSSLFHSEVNKVSVILPFTSTLVNMINHKNKTYLPDAVEELKSSQKLWTCTFMYPIYPKYPRVLFLKLL
jgi:hypothetical protein